MPTLEQCLSNRQVEWKFLISYPYFQLLLNNRAKMIYPCAKYSLLHWVCLDMLLYCVIPENIRTSLIEGVYCKTPHPSGIPIKLHTFL